MASFSATSDNDEASVLHRVATTGPGKTEWQFPERGLYFSSRFDGGNMAQVQLTPSGTFDVILSEDAAAFGISTGYSTWFYFEVERDTKKGVKTTKPLQELELTLVNLNPQRGLFKNGYTAMYSSIEVLDDEVTTATSSCVFQDEKRWTRLPSPLSFEKYSASAAQNTKSVDEIDEGENGQESNKPRETSTTPSTFVKRELKIRLSFTYKFKFAKERVRFAFCYPYTYTRVQKELATLDRQFAEIQQESLSTGVVIATTSETPTNIYYHRELLTRSLEGLRIDLITISSFDGMTSIRGPPHQRFDTSECPSSASAFRFDPKLKKMVVISARVHSGETPANFMLDGMLQLLLHPTDESAIALRRNFVFKIIPMLNPDGVCQGFYRTDTRGVNLNRVYEDPQSGLAPAVFALKELLLGLVHDYGGPDSASVQENMVYLDLHAHSNRRGCFIFGNNHIPDALVDMSNETMETGLARQVQTQLYARLVGLHTPFFDYMACLFDKDNMTRHDLRDNNNATTSRQGSSRVALYRATGLTYVYTIECNYNEGRRSLRASSVMPSSSSATASSAAPPKRCSTSKEPTQRAQSGNQRIPRQTAPTSGTRLYLKYTPAEWKDVGIGALIALLDLFELPGAGQQVEDSPFRSCDGIRKNLLAEIKFATSAGPNKVSKQNTRQVVKQRVKVKA